MPNFERIALAALKFGQRSVDWNFSNGLDFAGWTLYRKISGVTLARWGKTHYSKIWPYHTAFAIAVCYAMDN